MAYLMGESVELGIGAESTRGTVVSPSIWVPARTPTGIRPMVDKALVRETKSTGINSKDSEIVHSRAEGDVEFNLRHSSIGFMLESLFGTVGSVTALGATTHTFTVDGTEAQRPSLTLGLAQPAFQDYNYQMSMVNSIEINTPLDDLVTATSSFVSQQENTVGDYTPVYTEDDFYFRNHDVTIKIAANVAGLSGATPFCINESSLSIATNVRPKNCVGTQAASDILSQIMEITGSFALDHEDQTYHDLFTAGTPQAMEIKMERDDLAVIGSSALYPAVIITMPAVTFEEWTPERPLDDIVTETISYTAHYDATEAKAIDIVTQTELASF